VARWEELEWAELAIKAHCKRPAKSELDKADNPVVPAVEIPPARLEQLGERPRDVKVLEFVAQRVRELGGVPAPDASASQLKAQFGKLARERALTPAEKAQEAARADYLQERARRKEVSKEREGQRAGMAEAEEHAQPWRRDLRSLQRYVAEHTRGLRFEIHPASNVLWTDAQREVEFLRLWRAAGIALILGRSSDETLKLLRHPLTDVPGPGSRKKVWMPPGKGFVKPDSLAFEVLDSIINDPVWDDKLSFLTDGRMTFCNESFFHVLRKWGNKHYHYHRHYALNIWCALLSWNENIDRPILEYVWKGSKSGQLKSSAGRFYKVPIRAPKTAFWIADGWKAYRAWHDAYPFDNPPPQQPVRAFWLGWKGPSPPQRTRIVLRAPPTAHAQTAEREIGDMKAEELRTELASKGLASDGKVAYLRERVAAARANLDGVRSEEAQKVDQRELQFGSPRAAEAQRRQCLPAAGSSKDPPPAPIVQPVFGLPSPYKLPHAQRQRRKPPPKGQKKYTAKRVAEALERLNAGEQPEPLKRSRRQDGAEGSGEAMSEDQDEPDVLEDDF
jgi:hypothetical protein